MQMRALTDFAWQERKELAGSGESAGSRRWK
jgi:hypothetical protein